MILPSQELKDVLQLFETEDRKLREFAKTESLVYRFIHFATLRMGDAWETHVLSNPGDQEALTLNHFSSTENVG